jgi:hypothetical protein
MQKLICKIWKTKLTSGSLPSELKIQICHTAQKWHHQLPLPDIDHTASVAESFKSNESRLLICKPHYQSQQQATTEQAISHIPNPWALHPLSSVTWYKSIITQGNLMMKRCHISYHDEVIAKSFVLNKINRPLRGPWHACQCSWNLFLLFIAFKQGKRSNYHATVH